MVAREEAGPILNGIPSQLPDIDPEETQEWLDSLDGVVDESGRTRARYLMLKLLERARERQVGVPSLTATDYINTIPPEAEPWFPGDEEVERRYRAWLRWNAAVMVHRAQRPGIGVGGHMSSYASAATLYEVGFNHFFRGTDHEGGGDQIYIQGHASPGVYARAFLEGRLTEDQLDGFRQEHSHVVDGKPLALSSYPHPRLMPDFWEFPTVSMGLGPMNAIYQAQFNKYLHEPRHQGHLPAARVGVPRRRRDGRAGVAAACCSSPPTRSSTTSPSSSTATCSASTGRSAATARSSRSSRRSSAAPAGTSSRSSGAVSGTRCSPPTATARSSTS